jgi:hypothetical protein
MSKKLARLAVAAMAVTALVGCAQPKNQAAGPTPTTAAPITVPPLATATGSQILDEAPAVLADGRHPVYVTAIDAAGKKITFDLIIFLTGDAARAQWTKDHPGENVDDAALNGHLIINDNPKLRTLPVSGTVSVEALSVGTAEPEVITFSDLAGLGSLQGRPFWLTVAKGVVTQIEEQFIP